MTDHFKGACLCGALQYECNARPIAQFICYCKDCQKATGSVMAPAFLIKKSQVTITGQSSEYKVTGASGKPVIRHFCSTCGSRMYEQPTAMGQVYIFNSGSLADQNEFKPEGHFWVSSKPDWFKITNDLPQDPGQPSFSDRNSL